MYETEADRRASLLMKGNWTEASAFGRSVPGSSFSPSQQTPIDVIAARDDRMALSAQKRSGTWRLAGAR
jgi:hypothetical protein